MEFLISRQSFISVQRGRSYVDLRSVFVFSFYYSFDVARGEKIYIMPYKQEDNARRTSNFKTKLNRVLLYHSVHLYHNQMNGFVKQFLNNILRHSTQYAAVSYRKVIMK